MGILNCNNILQFFIKYMQTSPKISPNQTL